MLLTAVQRHPMKQLAARSAYAHTTKKQPSQRSTAYTVPGGTRTPGLLVRSQALYPAELQAHALTTNVIIAHGAQKVNAKHDN